MTSTGIWAAMGARLGLAGFAPELAEHVRLERGDEGRIQLVGPARAHVEELAPAEFELVRRFDGSTSLAELLRAGAANSAPLRVSDAMELIARLREAQLLAEQPASFWEQLDEHLAEGAIHRADASGLRALTAAMHRGQMDAGDQAVWRKRFPAYVERARFLREVPELDGLGYDELARIALASVERTFASLTDIVGHGEVADCWYVVRRGTAHRIEPGSDGTDTRVASYGPGGVIGTVDMLGKDDLNRRIRAGAGGPVVTLALAPELFGRFVAPHVPAFWNEAKLAFRRRRLAELPVFGDFEPEEIGRLAGMLREDFHAEGDVLIRQGEPGTSFYLIAKGSVVITRDGDPIARLGEGEFFGESALLFTEVRTASVVVDEPTVVWRLGRDAFDAVVRDRMRGNTSLMPTVLNRLRPTG